MLVIFSIFFKGMSLPLMINEIEGMTVPIMLNEIEGDNATFGKRN